MRILFIYYDDLEAISSEKSPAHLCYSFTLIMGECLNLDMPVFIYEVVDNPCHAFMNSILSFKYCNFKYID